MSHSASELPTADSFTQGEIDRVASSDPELDLAEITLADVYTLAADTNAATHEMLDIIRDLQLRVNAGVEALPGIIDRLSTLPIVGGMISRMFDTD